MGSPEGLIRKGGGKSKRGVGWSDVGSGDSKVKKVGGKKTVKGKSIVKGKSNLSEVGGGLDGSGEVSKRSKTVRRFDGKEPQKGKRSKSVMMKAGGYSGPGKSENSQDGFDLTRLRQFAAYKPDSDSEHGSATGSDLELKQELFFIMRDKNIREHELEMEEQRIFEETTELGGRLKIGRQKGEKATEKWEADVARRRKTNKSAVPRRRTSSSSSHKMKSKKSMKSKQPVGPKKKIPKTKSVAQPKSESASQFSEFDYGKLTGRSKAVSIRSKVGKKKKTVGNVSESGGTEFDYDDRSIAPVKTLKSKRSVTTGKIKTKIDGNDDSGRIPGGERLMGKRLGELPKKMGTSKSVKSLGLAG